MGGAAVRGACVDGVATSGASAARRASSSVAGAAAAGGSVVRSVAESAVDRASVVTRCAADSAAGGAVKRSATAAGGMVGGAASGVVGAAGNVAEVVHGATVGSAPSNSLAERISCLKVSADEVTELCATVSKAVYKCESTDQVQAMLTVRYGDAVRYSRLADRDAVGLVPAAVMAVVDDILVVAWAGSQTAMDWAMDLGSAPVSSPLWEKLAKGLKAHAGMAALVAGDYSDHRETLLWAAREFGVRRLIYTGHSLGGGLAQIAHLATLGQLHEHGKWEYSDLTHIDVEAVAFAAPMVFFLPEPLPEHLLEVVQVIGFSCRNYFVEADIVPRLPGLPRFWMPAMEEFVGAAVREKVAPQVDAMFGVGRQVSSTVRNVIHKNERTLALLTQYRHLSALYKVEVGLGRRSSYTMRIIPWEAFISEPYAVKSDSDNEAHVFVAACHSCLPSCMMRAL